MAGLNERLTLAIEANDNTSPAIREAIKNVKSLDTQTRRSTQSAMAQTSAMKKLGGAYRSSRMAAQNFSFQIQDIAVQLTAGQAASLVLAQQLPQLISGFGLVGAAIGAVVAVGAGLARAFTSSGEAASSFASTIEKTNTIMQGFEDSLDFQADSLDELKKKFSEAGEQARRFSQVNALISKIDLAEQLSEQQEALLGSSEDIRSSLNAFITLAKEAQGIFARPITDPSEAQSRMENRMKALGVTTKEQAEEVEAALKLIDQALIEFSTSDPEKGFVDLQKRVGEIGVFLSEIGVNSEKLKPILDDTFNLINAGRSTEYLRERLKLMDDVINNLGVDIVVTGDKIEKNLVDGFEKQAEAIKRARDPLYAYRQDLLELEEVFKTGGLSGESFNILKENLTKTFEEATKQIDPFKKQFEELASTISSGFESSFMSVIDGSKKAGDAFKDFARMVIKQLAKIALQKMVFGPLEQALTGFLGSAVSSTSAPTGTGMFDIPLRASGGPVLGNKTYMVGEKGPELFTPRSSGQITPNHRMGGSGEQIVINQNINVTTGVQQTVRAEILGLMPQITEASKMAVIDAKRRGGSFAGAF